ncbi:MAG: alpha/beta fold hydrolase [Deltaproteobacteria bacterium]|nr:alpha/beta fold hydrolase [Deltaproteobacteria bacterium]
MFHHNPQINPIYKKGSKDTAILLIHGFTGTPDCLRHLANHLHSLGYTVSAPLLAGHGTTRESLAKTGWKDWYQTCHSVFLEMQENHTHIFVAGLSLGGLLTLKLAEDYPQSINAIACLATPAFLNSWATVLLKIHAYTPLKRLRLYQKKSSPDVKNPVARKNFWNITDMPLSCIQSITGLQKKVCSNLHKVVCPTLIVHSRYDSTAPYASMNHISKNISAKVTETVTLENSFHLITIDYDKDLVSEKVGTFFGRHMSA